MSNDNLTNALYKLKEKDERPTTPAPKLRENTVPAHKKNALPFRKRSFDSFFGFSVALLVVALIAQVIAIITFS